MATTQRLSRFLVLIALTVLVLPFVGIPQVVGADPENNPAAMMRTLSEYGQDTWQSFAAMVYPETGLPTDNINAENRHRAAYTSPTNIGAYIWSTLAARDMQIIDPQEARDRIATTISTLERMERHTYSGMYYNWYDPATGAKLLVWPSTGDPITPFLSTVDNGWLATALIMVSNTVPQLRDRATAIVNSMDFGFYYDPIQGLMRGGFWDTQPDGCFVLGNYRGRGPDVYYTCHHYGSLNTEPRIASYIGIAKDGVPASHYFKMWRTFPDTCDWSWQEMRPAGETRTYLGVEVYEGHYTYRDMNLVPSWGGSMFEALMVALFVPEEEWGPQNWGINHPLYVQSQIEHGLQEANYGYWGFSPSNAPAGGYREYGVDPIGLNPDGYTSDEERTTVDYGFPPCRAGQPLPTQYGQGVVTPHASFLAFHVAPEMALQNLANLRANFDSYGWGGFYDAVNVSTGQVSKYYLSLDQGMIMAAIANAVRGDRLQTYFTHGMIEAAVRPILQIEQFTSSGDLWIR